VATSTAVCIVYYASHFIICVFLRCPVYIIHGTQDEIVPYYHGESLFNLLPDSSRTVPFWARGAGHNNIEMEMPTAYIKRLHQFIRQCDRVLYPPIKLASAANQVFHLANPSHLPKMMAAAHPMMKHCASNGTLNFNTEPNIMAPGCQVTPNDHFTQEQKNINKQRKQRGTLVMKSSHNSQPQMKYSHGAMTSHASKNAELQQQQQKQRLLIEQCRQQQLCMAQQYLIQNSPSQRVGQYQRHNSVPITMVSHQSQQFGGNVYQRE
jgi:hypothetical protein